MPKTIVFPASDDYWDADENKFVSIGKQTLTLEHSLISVSKWERKWKKPFLTLEEKTAEEWMDYIKCMTINQVNQSVYDRITEPVFADILKYIEDPMTATTFHNVSNRPVRRETITSEIIYYQMFSYGIPIELEKWHLNSLITLIHVFAVKSGGEKKMSRAEAAAYQRSLNESRRSRRR